MSVNQQTQHEIAEAGRQIAKEFEIYTFRLKRHLDHFRDGELTSAQLLANLELMLDKPLFAIAPSQIVLAREEVRYASTHAKNAREARRRAARAGTLYATPRATPNVSPYPAFGPLTPTRARTTQGEATPQPLPSPTASDFARESELSRDMDYLREMRGLGLDLDIVAALRGGLKAAKRALEHEDARATEASQGASKKASQTDAEMLAEQAAFDAADEWDDVGDAADAPQGEAVHAPKTPHEEFPTEGKQNP